MEKKVDLRIRRTEKMIRDALISLMEEKNFDEITVTDIADRAFINRNTFYLHYSDKNELLKSICEDCLKDWTRITSQPRQGNEQQHFRPMILDTLQEISKKRTFYRTMMTNSGTTYFVDQLKAKITAQMIRMIGDSEPNYQTLFCVEYIATGFLGAVRFVLDRNEEFEAGAMAQMVCHIVFHNATELLSGWTTNENNALI